MNGWVFVNNFIAGCISGGTFCCRKTDPTPGHPAYVTAWFFGIIIGLAVSLTALSFLIARP